MNNVVSASLLESLSPLWLSVQVAVAATVLASILGVGCALLMARKNFKGKELLDTLFILPMVLPPTVMGITDCAAGPQQCSRGGLADAAFALCSPEGAMWQRRWWFSGWFINRAGCV